jgi:predicted permease
MNDPSAQTVQTLTTETYYPWIDVPLAVALFFCLAGAFFIGIYILRRIRGKSAR